MGFSAGLMSVLGSGIGAAGASALGGLVLGKMMGGQKTPEVTPPPQQSQMPTPQGTLAAMKGAGATGGAPGIASTFLTGAGGIDPGLLNLGKNTLLGGGTK